MPDHGMAPCHGPAPIGWCGMAAFATCDYCHHVDMTRPEPVGQKDACWPCWAGIMFGEEDATRDHDWVGGGQQRCGVCGVHEAPPPDETEEEPDDQPEQIDAVPCPMCGQPGACGYDEQGRALIHAIPADDGED